VLKSPGKTEKMRPWLDKGLLGTYRDVMKIRKQDILSLRNGQGLDTLVMLQGCRNNKTAAAAATQEEELP